MYTADIDYYVDEDVELLKTLNKKKRVIVLGDTHGRAFWNLIALTQEWDELIFIGDYFDTHEDISGLEQMRNFEDIIEFKKNSDRKVIMLIGNHDFHYFPETNLQRYSGHQGDAKAMAIAGLLNEHRKHLQMAYSIDNILFSHAGIGEAWMERIVKHGLRGKLPVFNAKSVAKFVNEMWSYKPLVFQFTGRDMYGDDIGQTPIWIRPRSLMKDSQEMKKNGIIQVVGHTTQNCVDIKGKATGGKYYFIDTLGTSGEYLILQDGVFSVAKV